MSFLRKSQRVERTIGTPDDAGRARTKQGFYRAQGRRNVPGRCA